MKKHISLKRLGTMSTRYWSDTFELLLLHPVFHKEVLSIRKRFSIPVIGFPADEKSAMRWEKLCIRKSEAHFRSKEVIATRKKADTGLRKGKISSFQFEKIEKQINDAAFKNDFNNHIRFLVRSFSLPPSFTDGIESYIKYGIKRPVYFIPKGYDVKVVFENNKPSHCALEIHEPLSREEWTSIRLHVEDLQEKWLKKKKRLMMPIHRLARDIELLAISKKGFSSEMTASEYWQDDIDADFSVLKQKDKRGALIVRQAKTRIKAQMKERFPGVTLH